MRRKGGGRNFVEHSEKISRTSRKETRKAARKAKKSKKRNIIVPEKQNEEIPKSVPEGPEAPKLNTIGMGCELEYNFLRFLSSVEHIKITLRKRENWLLICELKIK